ncbi:MAG: tyrosine-type recombinase/integrase [Xanthobacteraceae bacterium]
MARQLKRLSVKKIQHAKPPEGRDSMMLADGGNLFLQITRADDTSYSRSWVFAYQMNHKRHWMGLGPTHTVSATAARERARQLREQIVLGIDPLAAKRETERQRLAERAKQEALVTFKACTELFLKKHSSKWARRHAKQWQETVERLFPVLGHLAVKDIETEHLRKALEPIWEATPETGRRLRARLETILEFAGAAGYRNPALPNPARLEVLKYLLGGEKRRVQHLDAMPYAEVPQFLADLRGRKPSPATAALEVLILTAARSGEILGARWSEIDLKAATWTIPAERMKSKRQHRIPLSKRVLDVLTGLTRKGDLIFSRDGAKALRSDALTNLLHGLRPDTAAVVHGFRSSFRDWCAERTNFPREVCEQALAHAVGSKTEQSYKRSDHLEQRRKLMAQWATYLSKPLPAEGANVTELHAARS